MTKSLELVTISDADAFINCEGFSISASRGGPVSRCLESGNPGADPFMLGRIHERAININGMLREETHTS